MIWRRKRVFRIWSALSSHRLALTESWLLMLISMLHCCVSCMGKKNALYVCNIWSVIVSERKMIVLLFAFYALCHFGSPIIATKYYCCYVWCQLSLHFGFLLEEEDQGRNFRRFLWKRRHSRFIIPLFVNIWTSGSNWPIFILSSSFFPNPRLSYLSPCSSCVSNIVQCSTRESVCDK